MLGAKKAESSIGEEQSTKSDEDKTSNRISESVASELELVPAEITNEMRSTIYA
jgi:hypothetical protein